MKTFLLSLLTAMTLAAAGSLSATVPEYTGQPLQADNQYLIAGWNFNTGATSGSATPATFDVTRGSGTLIFEGADPNAVVVFGGTVTNRFHDDIAGSALAIRNGTEGANNGSHLEFQLDSSLFKDPVLSFAVQRTSTGFTQIEVSYSIDGGQSFSVVQTITDIASSFGSSSEVPAAIRTADFTGLISGQSDVRVRLTFDGGSLTASTGNNRLDNFQFCATAIASTATTDGTGLASLTNVTSGSLLAGSIAFQPASAQSVAVKVAGQGSDPLTSVSVTVPEGWAGLSGSNVVLSGSGFSGASASVSGNIVTVSNAALTDSADGAITLNDLSVPPDSEISGFGEQVFEVKTAIQDGTLTSIKTSPKGSMIIPISRLRPVDAQGVSLGISQTVAVSGVATVENYLFNQPRFSTYLQDESVGIAIDYALGFEVANQAVRGGQYVAIGTVTQYNGLLQITLVDPADFIDFGSATMPEPLVLTIAQYLQNPERYEGMLIRLPSVSKTETSNPWPSESQNVNLTITEAGGDTLTLRIWGPTGISNMPEPTWPRDIVGLAGQFDSSSPYTSGYQIFPRDENDFLEPSEPPPPDNDFAAWAQGHFGNGTVDSGPQEDPDGDGIPNLLEYAFGGNPLASSWHLLPETIVSSGILGVIFARSRDATDITYSVQASSDLTDWVEIWSSGDHPYASSEEFADETVWDAAGGSASLRRFLRVAVTQN